MRARPWPEVLAAGALAIFWVPGPFKILVGLLVLAVAGFAIARVHPRLVLVGLGFSLGLIPFGGLGGLPAVLPATIGLWIVTGVRSQQRSRGAVELWTIGLMLTSLLSVIMVRVSSLDYGEFGKWVIATSLVLALTKLPTADLMLVLRSFTYGAAGAAVVGILLATVDKGQVSMKPFGVFGYQGAVVQYVYGAEATTERLAGTFLNPNAAGIFLMVALTFAIALFSGRRRAALTVVIVVALALTLSRAAMGGLAVAAVLLLVVHPMGLGRRARTIGVLAAAMIGGLLTPAVSERFLDSFGSSDAGSDARAEALHHFPRAMEGAWAFGLGWARPEFLDADTAFITNHVANAPLLTIYRGGVLCGIAFVGIMIAGMLVSRRHVIASAWAPAVIGASFIGFCLVTMQLDFPVVTIQSVTAVYSFFIAALVRGRDLGDQIEQETKEAALAAQPRPSVRGVALAAPRREVVRP